MVHQRSLNRLLRPPLRRIQDRQRAIRLPLQLTQKREDVAEYRLSKYLVNRSSATCILIGHIGRRTLRSADSHRPAGRAASVSPAKTGHAPPARCSNAHIPRRKRGAGRLLTPQRTARADPLRTTVVRPVGSCRWRLSRRAPGHRAVVAGLAPGSLGGPARRSIEKGAACRLPDRCAFSCACCATSSATVRSPRSRATGRLLPAAPHSQLPLLEFSRPCR